MRFAIFGDIHSNLEALQAVLADAELQKATHYVCLGDIVGYNANPKECVELVRSLNCPTIKGNHDELAGLDFRPENVSELANQGIGFTRDQLSAGDIQWLNALKLVRQVRDFTIVHATLDTPQKWGYVFSPIDAMGSFSYQYTQVCFFGHTHYPRAYIREPAMKTLDGWREISIEKNKKYFINVGSVGQPRDGDWRAAYAIYHVQEGYVELRRVDYDIHRTQEKILQAGLPEQLALRLEVGQ